MERDVQTVLADPERLAALRRTALLDTAAEEAFDRLARLAARVLAAPVALVTLVDEDRQFFKSCVGLRDAWATARETPLSHSFCQHAVVSGEPFVVTDVRTHPLVRENPAIGDLGVVAYAGVPLTAPAGETLGALCVIDTAPRRWTDGEIETLIDLGAAVTTEIGLRVALADAGRRDRQRALLLEAAHLLASTLDEHELVDGLARLVAESGDWCVVQTVDDGTQPRMTAVAHADPAQEPLLAEAAAGAVEIPALARAYEELRETLPAAPATFGPVVVAPLHARGRAVGVVAVAGGPSPSADDVLFVDLIAQRAALAVDNARLFTELDAERRRLRDVLEAMRQGVVTVDSSLRVRFANQAARRTAGLGALEVGATIPDAWPGFSLAAFAAALFVEDRERHASYAPTADASYSLVGIPAGRADEAVIVLTDLAEISRRERAEREFVTNAAHELRTPLTAISSAIDVLQAGAKDVPSDRDVFLQDIEREAARLRRLTRALLVLAEIQAQQTPAPLDVVDVQALLHDVLAGVQPRMGVDVVVRCDPGLTAMTNADLAAQALATVVENAMRYTTAGRVSIAAAAAGGHTAIVVADTGPGIPDADGDRIFERFYQGDERTPEGFGLGLSIAKQAIESVGATIDVQPAQGGGTAVRITLPRER